MVVVRKQVDCRAPISDAAFLLFPFPPPPPLRYHFAAMVTCDRDGCTQRAAKRCAGCMHAFYCTQACQKKAWKTHKTECKARALVHMSRDPDELPLPPPERPDPAVCTACGMEYSPLFLADQRCPDCGYTTCAPCGTHREKGSCYCQDSNFGWRYCEREPRPYHMSSHTRQLYSGDYHPDAKATEYGPDVRRDLYEDAPRRCTGCGEVKLCLKKGSAQWYRETYDRERNEAHAQRAAFEQFFSFMRNAGL